MEEKKEKATTKEKVSAKEKALIEENENLIKEIEQLKIWENHFETYATLQQEYQEIVTEITKRLEKQQKAVQEAKNKAAAEELYMSLIGKSDATKTNGIRIRTRNP